ncbi:MAG: hypothetical protein J6B01_12030 [Ruminococcus sp.]|nr:hypothetical protein [Ruminococcus sp.]
MKKLIAMLTAAILISTCITSCGSKKESGHKWENLDTLNEWQISLLEAEGLPTDYDELTANQQNTITRIWTMISYLNEKYGEEFIYVDYIAPELNQSETLTAYPRSTGSGNGKYLITVKSTKDGFTDNYFDFGVEDLAEELTNEFLTEHFGDSYKYFVSPLACDIKMSEMEDGKFQWKYGAENGIFLLEDECSIDDVEEFAVEYANFLYEHELCGSHRIEVLKEFPEDEEIWARKGVDLYGSPERWSTGFYCLSSDGYRWGPTVYHTVNVKYDLEGEWYLAEIYHIGKDYSVDEFLSKYD